MKLRASLFLLIILSLLLSSGSIHVVEGKRGGETDDKLGNIYGFAAAQEEITWEKVGLENCDEAEEECIKRRMMSDAHLDYIYTQNLKP